MNIVKTKLILLFLYLNDLLMFRSHFLKKLVKYLLGNNRISINYRNIKLYVSSRSSIEYSILFNEYNEGFILDIIRFFSEREYNFIDVGSNIGVHSLVASKSNSTIQVYAFEPEKENYHCFLRNICLNHAVNIVPINFGIGDKSEIKHLNINEGWNKGKHSYKNHLSENSKRQKNKIFKLDEFYEVLNFQKCMIKIDVEGFEKEVLDGAEKTFTNNNNCILIIELIESLNGIERCIEIIKKLRNFGFEQGYSKLNSENYYKVNNFQGDGDYIFIKGDMVNHDFKKYLSK